MGKSPLKILIIIFIALLLGSAWNIGSRRFLPKAALENLLRQGIRAYRDGQLDVAFSHFSEAAQKAPSDATAHYLLAQSLESLGREEEAITHYRNALTLDPSQAAPHYNLAVIYNRRKDLSAAAEELKKAVQLNRHFHGARFMLAGVYMGLEDYTSAIGELERLLQSRELDKAMEIQVRTFLARAHLAADNTERARQEWQEILRLDHTNQEAQEQLGKLR